MFATSHLDWLAATYPVTVSPNATIPAQFLQQPFANKGHARHGYRTLLQNPQGISVMLNGSEAQGTHLDVSASALHALREAGLTDRALCQYVTDNGGKVTRADAAVNLHDGLLTVEDIVQAFAQGRAKTRARSCLRRKGIACTTYGSDGSSRDRANSKNPKNQPWLDDSAGFGSLSSDKYLRAYDKRVELRIDGPSWLRLELECHRLIAQNLALSIANTENTRTVINGSVKAFFNVMELVELQEALSDSSSTPPEVPRKFHNTLSWLTGQVVMAASKYQDSHPDQDVWAIMTSAYQLLRDRAESRRF